ncbi:MAG TPA: methyl-accepting chemotaxis protein [Noviherbaspirillum sp.]|nr:methyl-accepting chemotaxis protein [Noviherbaspirillum sp.]
MKVSDMKIGARLGAGFGFVLALLVVVTVFGLSRAAHIQDNLDRIVNVKDVEVDLARDMRATVTDQMIALRNLALMNDAEEMKPEVERIKSNTARYAEAEQKLAKIFAENQDTKPEEKAFLDRLKAVETAARPLMDKAMELGLANNAAEATSVLIKDVRPQQFKWMAELGDLITLEKKLNTEAAADAHQAYRTARMMMIVLGLVAIAAGMAGAWLITRSITGPMRRAVQIAETVARGDLTSKIRVDRRDETGQLLQALKDMNESLVRIVGEVRIGTDTIATASNQIASGNLDLSSRTEQQASSLEETASSMEELTTTVKQNADNARQANQLAASAAEVAVKGGAVVSQVVDTMGAINDSAKKIVDIIGVIDGIAFQTNILALNAAVEAARAGEQGRGFAVVASEVRSLAQRSASAAKEIKALIGDSVDKVDSGSRLVDQAGSTMQEVVESVKRVTDIISEITAASDEQRTGIEQVNQAIGQMDQVTQQNAALVEEAAAAADALQNQAASLAQVVSVFKLDGMQAAARPAVDITPKAPAVAMEKKKAPRIAASAAAAPVRKIAKAGADDGWEEF